MGIINALTSAVNSLTGGAHSVDRVIDGTAKGVTVRPGSTLSSREVLDLIQKLGGMTPADLHASQPNLRAVVDFRARNVAQLGLHVYKPAEKGRERDRTSAAALVIGNPSPAQTGYQLIYSLVADLDLYDEAFWFVAPSRRDAGFTIRPLPVADIVDRHGNEWSGNFSVSVLMGGKTVHIPAENLIHFRGYSPSYGSYGSSPIHALRDTLTEQVAAQNYRLSVWKNGGMISSYVSRPSSAPDWSHEAATRFRENMAEFRSGGSRQGGMPVLEDGMKIEAGALNSKEQQYVEAAQLSLATVARTYHVNPAMLGETGGVTYANMREFRKSLYGETLGPLLRMVEDYLNTRLMPMLGITDGSYFEFNVKEKLRGSFEEEAEVLSKSVGNAAWMTVNEARGTQNLKPIEGGDILLQPLNMDTVGHADDDEPPVSNGKGREVSTKAAVSDFHAEQVKGLIDDFSRRQQAAVTAALNSKASPDWWAGERWDKELAADLTYLAQVITAQIGTEIASSLGYTGTYDIASTTRFLAAVAETRAHMINEGTREALERALADTSENAKTPDDVFSEMRESRGHMWATSIGATLAGFATVEAGRQVARRSQGERVVKKTWIVRSNNPRDTHAAMNGQTVGIDELFSNGSKWPGDSAALPASEVANCQCGVEITTED